MRKGRTDKNGRRMEARERQQSILYHALLLSQRHGYQNVTRSMIADAMGCSPSLVNSHYGTIPQFRRAIMSAAIAMDDLRVLAQGLAAGDAKARSAPQEMRERAAALIAR